MKNRIYASTALLCLSAYCAGSENAGKSTASDFDVLQSRMAAYEKHCNIPSFFSWDYWFPCAIKAYRCADYYKGIQNLEDALKNTEYAQKLNTTEMVARKQKLDHMNNFWRRYAKLNIVDVVPARYPNKGYVVWPPVK
jgi:hypothetical protein